MNKKTFYQIRQQSIQICQPLATEDYVVQPHPDVSPPKWHLAHTTWFFEEVILKRFQPGYVSFNERYNYLFNSYYNSAGERWPRERRGVASRPTVDEVLSYRRYIDNQIGALLEKDVPTELWQLIEVGCHHEQQHQELMLMDILAIFFHNGVQPAYCHDPVTSASSNLDCSFQEFTGGITTLGTNDSGFCYDNERPRHQVYLNPFQLRKSCVTNGEYLEFIEDNGYGRPEFWLSDGWGWCQQNQVRAPEYWERIDGTWLQFTLHGWNDLDMRAPVAHISFYEAYAFARWKGKRLPTEAEWEHAAQQVEVNKGVFIGSGGRKFVPGMREGLMHSGSLSDLYGNLWNWTASEYGPYPGYREFDGMLGEYNGKFMCNQRVLKGGSFATPVGHFRKTYRNFFYPHQRWQFAGFRLAE